MKFDARINQAMLLLDQIIEEMETGFVPCRMCEECTETKDLYFFNDIKEVRSLLAKFVGQPQSKGE